jgi:hypothetical protein
MVVVVATSLAPVWSVALSTLFGLTLTVGRVALVGAGGLIVASRIRRGSWPTIPGLERAVGLIAVCLWAWVILSASTRGCGTCGGQVAGLSELIALAMIAFLAAAYSPTFRGPMMIACGFAGLLGAVLALAGVGGLTEGTRLAASARLSGTYGNPNELALAAGFAIPVGLALVLTCPWRLRPPILAALGVVAVTLAMTYSRGGALAVTAGGLAAVAALAPTRKQVLIRLAIGTGTAFALAALAYPQFEQSRQALTAKKPPASLKAVDRSGWDPTKQGLLPTGPSVLSPGPRPGTVKVTARLAGSGVSYPVGVAASIRRYVLAFDVRSTDGRTQFEYGLEDNLQENGPRRSSAQVGQAWRRLSLSWRPTRRSRDARIYFWSTEGSQEFLLRRIAVREPDRAGEFVRPHMRVVGSEYAHRLALNERAKERHDISSRSTGVRLAMRAFREQPIQGIGWGRFPAFAAAHARFGRLPTHDEYLRFLAELGAVGALLLAAMGGALALVVARVERDRVTVAAVGVVVLGATALVFANALVNPSVTAPLAIGVAVLCTGRVRA